jgi:hypothetical protein
MSCRKLNNALSAAGVGLLLFVLLNFPVLAERRVALLIGNAGYSIAPLNNPPNDLQLMKGAFDRAGFDAIVVRSNLDRATMTETLAKFEDEVRRSDIAVFYFSGHGIEMDGVNYLIPIDAKLKFDRDVKFEAIPLDDVMQALSGAVRLKLIILDACRNNPFVKGMHGAKTRGDVGRGLVRVDSTVSDQLIAFAAAPGQIALDGSGSNSPYAESLAKLIPDTNADIRIVLGKVRDEVAAATNDQQIPYFTGSLGGQITTLAAPSKRLQDVANQSNSAENTDAMIRCNAAAAHWAEAKLYDQLEYYQQHLALFGSCAFSDFARVKIEEKKRLNRDGVSLGDSDPSLQVPVTDCDRLAADPFDDGRRGPGIEFESMDGLAARTACEQAVKTYPSISRFRYQLGRAYQKMSEFGQAAEHFRAAAVKGNACAQFNLGLLYERGDGVVKSDAEALSLYMKAADSGFGWAFFNLGNMYADGRSVKRDQKKALEFYRRSADKGISFAQFTLGRIYEEGQGVQKDESEAARLYMLAANARHAWAQFNLGNMYSDGRGVPKDYVEAAAWYRTAAENGLSEAQFKLGLYYLDGVGVPKSEAEAVGLFRQAAEKRNPWATLNLAEMYSAGRGVSKDDAEAVRLYQRAIDEGNITAMVKLASFYIAGRGVSKNYTEAARLLTMAARSNDKAAMEDLARLYDEGRGVKKDPAEAGWLRDKARKLARQNSPVP